MHPLPCRWRATRAPPGPRADRGRIRQERLLRQQDIRTRKTGAYPTLPYPIWDGKTFAPVQQVGGYAVMGCSVDTKNKTNILVVSLLIFSTLSISIALIRTAKKERKLAANAARLKVTRGDEG